MRFLVVFLLLCACSSAPQTSKLYGDVDAVKTHLQQVATDLGDLVAFYGTYGNSEDGRPLMYVRINTSMVQKPAVWLNGGMHGNEDGGVEVTLDALDHFATGIKNHDPVIAGILDRYNLYFLPVNNPDGYAEGVREANGVDPNREFPWPDTPNRNPNACIKNLMSFFDSTLPVASIDFHTSGGYVMYPWGYTRSTIPEQSDMDKMAKAMAATVDYTPGQIARVLYIAEGNSADYFYWKNKTKAFAVEVGRFGSEGTDHHPSYSEYESLWAMVLKMFEMLP